MIDSAFSLTHTLHFLKHEVGERLSCFGHSHVGFCLGSIVDILSHNGPYSLERKRGLQSCLLGSCIWILELKSSQVLLVSS